jgi:CubicO group peptidase (beta-lactamase class C family)
VKKRVSIETLLSEGVRDGAYPGAVLLVAQGGNIVFFKKEGHRVLIPSSAPMYKDVIFDLASLTKPLATTLAIMKLVDEGKIHLDQPLPSLLFKALPRDKDTITPRLLLSHSAGFADWEPLYLALDHLSEEKRKPIVRERLLDMPLTYEPGKQCLYSDLGFMILEWIVEETTGIQLHRFLNLHFYSPLLFNRTFLSNDTSKALFKEDQFAATEACPWRKKVLLGSVHDENAFAVGGYSGHAGLFGTAEEVYALVNLLRLHFRGEREDYLNPNTVKTFFSRQGIVEGSTWALGWDTPSPRESSSGRYFSAKSVGHLGFTGTSVWMDLEQDVIVIFLTNRIHPSRNNEKIKAFRPKLHDLIMEELIIH